MFYENQPDKQKNRYKVTLRSLGSLSRLFSSSDEPYLYYRAHENAFCKCFEADNLSREDCSADAAKDSIGVGLKTWVGRNDQKVAEFGRLRPQYQNLTGIDLIRAIATYRNERIRITKNLHGLTDMIYHIVKRIPGVMEIYESAFDYIDIDNISIDGNRGQANNIYFNDGKHTYHFSLSKNTLYMIFDDMILVDSLNVDILDDPFEVITPDGLFTDEDTIGEEPEGQEADIEESGHEDDTTTVANNKLYLRLYSVKSDGTKFVPDSAQLNQWNGARKDKNGIFHKRNVNELYISFPAVDRSRKPDFFPPRDTPFSLHLPDGKVLSAKVCQDGGKAIMSNPNKDLGKWLLRDVFELPEDTLVTYNMLRIFNIDCVEFTKLGDLEYSIDFCPLGEYERRYGLDDSES